MTMGDEENCATSEVDPQNGSILVDIDFDVFNLNILETKNPGQTLNSGKNIMRKISSMSPQRRAKCGYHIFSYNSFFKNFNFVGDSHSYFLHRMKTRKNENVVWAQGRILTNSLLLFLG